MITMLLILKSVIKDVSQESYSTIFITVRIIYDGLSRIENHVNEYKYGWIQMFRYPLTS